MQFYLFFASQFSAVLKVSPITWRLSYMREKIDIMISLVDPRSASEDKWNPHVGYSGAKSSKWFSKVAFSSISAAYQTISSQYSH